MQVLGLNSGHQTWLQIPFLYLLSHLDNPYFCHSWLGVFLLTMYPDPLNTSRQWIWHKYQHYLIYKGKILDKRKLHFTWSLAFGFWTLPIYCNEGKLDFLQECFMEKHKWEELRSPAITQGWAVRHEMRIPAIDFKAKSGIETTQPHYLVPNPDPLFPST